MSDANPTKYDKAVEKLEAVRAVKKLSGDGPWSLVQEVMQEVVAGYIVKNPDSVPSSPKLREELLKELSIRYVEDENLQLFLDSVPSSVAIRAWFKKDGWDDAVWSKIRVEGLFTKEKRSEVIEALRTRAIDKSDSAAKLWLTMSGDYQEKDPNERDKTLDAFREINKIIHGTGNKE